MQAWAIARYDLCIADAEFWRMTPRLLDALLDRHQDAQRMIDFRFGMIAMFIHNSNCEKGAEKSIEDLYPSLKSANAPAQSVDEQLALVEHLNLLFGGEDLRPRES